MTDQVDDQPAPTAPEVSATPVEGMAGDSVSVAGWTLVSRATGFARVVVIAAVLGPTFFGNLFEATNQLPNLAFELLAGPLITAMLVPHLVRLLDGGLKSSAQKLANGFLGVLIVVFSVAVIVVVAVGPLVLGMLTLLVPDAAVRADQLAVGWPLLAMVMPQAVFYGVAATGIAAQNANGKFALAAAAPALENLVIIAVMAVSAVTFGVGAEVGEITTPQLLFLGLGTTVGVAAHAALQWWGAHRVGIRLVPKAGWRDTEVRKVLRMAVPTSGFAVLAAVRTFVPVVVAGSIPGGVIAYNMGRYFFNLPVALAARPVMVAQLPRLARAFNEKSRELFAGIYRSGIELILFMAVPASLLLIGLSGPFARAAAFGEMATDHGVRMIAVAIATLAVGIVGESLFLAATSAFYSRGNARSPMVAMAVRFGLTAAGAVVAVAVADGIAVLLILGLGVALSDVVTGFALHRSLEKSVGVAARRAPQTVNLVISVAAVAIGAGLATVAGNVADGTRFAGAVIGSGAVVFSYLVMQRARHSPQLAELAGVFRRSGSG